MATTSSMFLYSLTIQPPSANTQAILGQFSGTREQQILTACGSRLTLSRLDPTTERLTELVSHDVFGVIRSLCAFRIAGSSKDYIVIGSDSGRISIIEYVPAKNRFRRLHLETFGKSGVRRVIPGQYLATDPKGRACMIASVEKNKLAYVLNRNSQAELTISSPLEAHKPGTIVFALVGLDVGYDNPIFAALEVEYDDDKDEDEDEEEEEEREKQLVYYELDLGLNHVVRKWSDTVDRTANILFQVPGGADGPSGVLVCGEENITYRHPGQDPLRVVIPRRLGATENPERKRIITGGVMHKMRGAFFFLLQTEDGDLFKLTLDVVTGDDGSSAEVSRLRLKYFDTVPLATSLLILKSGFLYVGAENGNHQLFQFEKLGDEDDEPEFTSDDYPVDPRARYKPAYFQPRGYENITPAQSLDTLHPLIGAHVTDAEMEPAEIYTVSGTGARSTFQRLIHGLPVSEIVSSELPSAPSAIWTTKLKRDDQYDAYIVLSFTNGTLVLSIGETVEEVTGTGFLSSAPTLVVQLLGQDALIQVHSRGIRHIKPGGVANEWPSPPNRTIVAAVANEQQVAVALSSGEIVYFEVDSDGSLAEYDERKQMPSTVSCLGLASVPEGRVRASQLVVGCEDATVRILSLDPDSTLENRSIQALTAAPTALRVVKEGSEEHVHIGLVSGVYLRALVDESNGELSDTRVKFLGPKPVRLFEVKVQGKKAILALSTHSWLAYTDDVRGAGGFAVVPLEYAGLEWAAGFTSEQCDEGVVGIEGSNLRIFTIESIAKSLISHSTSLAYTPRAFVKHPDQNLFYVAQAEYNVLPASIRQKLMDDAFATAGGAKVESGANKDSAKKAGGDANADAEMEEVANRDGNGDTKMVNGATTPSPSDPADLSPEQFGYPHGTNHWSSCLQVIDPFPDQVLGSSPTVTYSFELDDNEAAVSLTVAPFSSQDNEPFLLLGTAVSLVTSPRSHAGGFIHVFRFQNDGRSLEFIHKTKTTEPPVVLRPFRGRLLAGLGSDLVLFDLGMRQVLRKAMAPSIVPNLLVDIRTQGNRIICADVQESVTYAVYKPNDNKLLPFADDVIARWTTATAMVDYETVAGGDKFGNLWLVRCPPDASAQADEEGAAHLIHERQYLRGTPHRVNLMAHSFTADIPRSIQKVRLVPGAREVLFWAGLQGLLGALVPITAREDVDFLQSLEQQLRTEDPPLAGRDHLAYRSYYVPVKGVIDGDLCERFGRLDRPVKEKIAAELDRSVREVERKISEMRTRTAF